MGTGDLAGPRWWAGPVVETFMEQGSMELGKVIIFLDQAFRSGAHSHNNSSNPLVAHGQPGMRLRELHAPFSLLNNSVRNALVGAPISD